MPSSDPSRSRRAGALVLLALLLLKLTVLTAWGPLHAWDSREYERYAAQVQAGTEWLQGVDLQAEAIPVTTFRAPGYPLAIASTQVMFGPAWSWALVLFQITASLGASLAFYLLARRVGLGDRGAALVVLCQGTSNSVVWDQFIATDSLYSSAFLITLSVIGCTFVSGKRLRPLAVLGLGVVLAGCTTFREATPYLLLSFLPLLVAWSARVAPRRRWAAGVLLLLLAPTLLVVLGLRSWNRARTGHAFVTTSAQTAMLFPLFDLARQGTPVFEGDRRLDQAVRAAAPTLVGVEIYEVNANLHRVHGLTAIEIARLADAAYRDAWLRYPGAMLQAAFARLHPIRIFFVRPMRAVLQIRDAAGTQPPPPWPGRRALALRLVDERRPSDLLLLVGATVFPLLSTLVFLAFLLGPPGTLLLRRRRGTVPSPSEWLLAGLWLASIGFTATYMLVALEMRYLTPIIPFVLLGGGATLGAAWQRVSAKRSRE